MQKQAILSSLSDEDVVSIAYDWYGWWARPAQQIPPGLWRLWLVLAGRGFGKTRTGAEWVRRRVESGAARRIALVARTKADMRDVMVEGESGLLVISHPAFRPDYEPSKRRLTWPNGAVATLFSADEPDQLRGPQCDTFWADELASWRRPEAFDNLMFGFRLSDDPRGIITTTPKRTSLFRSVLTRSGLVTTGGSTYENLDNLAPTFRDEIINAYEGTRVGQQEIYALVQDDNPDALWRYETIERTRRKDMEPGFFRRIVVAVDPEGSSLEEAAETGIIVAGRGQDRHLYILADYTIKGTPRIWGQEVARAYHEWHADLVVGEVNNGGEMVGFVLETVDRTLPYKPVRASRGKNVRAEPVSALYEKGHAHHVGVFADLETQMTQWMPGEKSPDRLDAMVWAATELMLGGQITNFLGASTTPRFGGDMAQTPRALPAPRRAQQLVARRSGGLWDATPWDLDS